MRRPPFKTKTATIRNLRKAFPHLENTNLIGQGNFGYVVEHVDGTLSKVITYPRNPYDREFSLKLFYSETAALSFFKDIAFERVDVPILLGEPEHLYHPDYIATYRMTRINGSNNIVPPRQKAPDVKKAFFERVHESTGELLARFQRSARDFPRKVDGIYNDQLTIPHLIGYSVPLNRALEKANDYLQANKQAGVIHGDFYSGNVLVQNGEATGLVDFSFTGRSDNIFTDLVRYNAGIHTESFLAGYERESGIKIPRFIVDTIKLGFVAHDMNAWREYHEYTPEIQTANIVEMNTILNRLLPLTDYKP